MSISEFFATFIIYGQRRKFFIKTATIFFFSLFSLAFTSIAFAQTPPGGAFDITVSPTFFDLSSKPDTEINQTIKLRNNTASKITLNVAVSKMGADENGELAIKNTDDGTLSWIELSGKQVSIPPREWVNVPFVIKVPANAAFGYYWAVSFTQEANIKQKGIGAKVNASIVVPVLLNVQKEGAIVAGKLKGFTTDSFFYEYLPVTFKTTFSNNGNVHIAPRGNIFIHDFLGRQIAVLDVNNAQGIVLPNVTRSFDVSWSDSFIWYEPKLEDGQPVLDKNGKPERQLKFDFKKILDLRIGKYTATAVFLVSGDKRDYTYQATTTFFVMPWKILIGSIVFVLLAAIGFFSTAKTVIRRLKKMFSKKDTE